ncbi:MAG: preprotein translocase subunit YajC [Chloroflexi bacterium]|nr:preprotein translocase subunit YajC [Chloroflexota bacterium]
MFGNSIWVDIFVLLIFFGVIYAFIILPRQLNFRRTQRYVKEGLEPGEEIVTYGGMVGTVQRVDAEEGIVYLEIAPDVVIRVITASIASRFDPELIRENAQKGQGRLS